MNDRGHSAPALMLDRLADRAEFAAFQREVATPEVAAKSLAAVYSFDVSDRLGCIRVPVTVLHRRGDTAIPAHLGKELAAAIPGASFPELEGSDHLPWRGRTGELARATLEDSVWNGPKSRSRMSRRSPQATPARRRSRTSHRASSRCSA